MRYQSKIISELYVLTVKIMKLMQRLINKDIFTEINKIFYQLSSQVVKVRYIFYIGKDIDVITKLAKIIEPSS